MTGMLARRIGRALHTAMVRYILHDNDLDDAAGGISSEMQISSNLRSGCYGVSLDEGTTQDMIPLFVRPDRSIEKPLPVTLVMPTLA